MYAEVLVYNTKTKEYVVAELQEFQFYRDYDETGIDGLINADSEALRYDVNDELGVTWGLNETWWQSLPQPPDSDAEQSVTVDPESRA